MDLIRSLFLIHLLVIYFLSPSVSLANGPISQQEARDIALTTKEAKAFLGMLGGKYTKCIESKALRSCDSDWVTCIEDGWVVEFRLDPVCGISHDGRLQLTLVLNAEGVVISRYPETDYFSDPQYCMEDYECAPAGRRCINFIYGPLAQAALDARIQCACRDNRCRAL